MDTILTILLIAIALVIAYVIWKKYKKPESGNELLTVFSDTIETTNLGATVASKGGVSQTYKNWIDESLKELFDDCRIQGYYGEWLDYSKFTIYALHTCILSPESGVPSFLVRADNYDGTVYDQDPTVGVGKTYAAEMVISNENGSYVICISDDKNYVKNATRYGAEHIILYHVDRDTYEDTKTHFTSGHPLIPQNKV